MEIANEILQSTEMGTMLVKDLIDNYDPQAVGALEQWNRDQLALLLRHCPHLIKTEKQKDNVTSFLARDDLTADAMFFAIRVLSQHHLHSGIANEVGKKAGDLDVYIKRMTQAGDAAGRIESEIQVELEKFKVFKGVSVVMNGRESVRISATLLDDGRTITKYLREVEAI